MPRRSSTARSSDDRLHRGSQSGPRGRADLQSAAIAPSTFYAHAAIARDPGLASDRAKQDIIDAEKIKDAFDGSDKRYGARKIWHDLRREGHDIARCTVERLMKVVGIQGVVRSQKPITTNPDTSQPCPDDKVNRDFTASTPNQLWASDFTYVSSWQGMVYVAFVIDAFARKILGWRVSTSMTTGFVLDALNQAICQRAPSGDLVHHWDRGSQYLSIRYTERLAEAGIDPSVGSVGDSYDNALGSGPINPAALACEEQKSSGFECAGTGGVNSKREKAAALQRFACPLDFAALTSELRYIPLK